MFICTITHIYIYIYIANSSSVICVCRVRCKHNTSRCICYYSLKFCVCCFEIKTEDVILAAYEVRIRQITAISNHLYLIIERTTDY